MAERLKIGDIVKHFKRETLENPGYRYLYKIRAITQDTETGGKLVTYSALYADPSMNGIKFGDYTRPYNMFMSKVDTEKYPDIKQKYRFEKVKFTPDPNNPREYIIE